MFEELLDEAYNKLKHYNTEQKKLILPKIELDVIPTRVHWTNFKDYALLLNTDINMLYKFIKNELCSYAISWYSNNNLDGIIIHGKYIKSVLLHNLIKKYITLYCTCKVCKSVKTELQQTKNNYFNLRCITCFSEALIKV